VADSSDAWVEMDTFDVPDACDTFETASFAWNEGMDGRVRTFVSNIALPPAASLPGGNLCPNFFGGYLRQGGQKRAQVMNAHLPSIHQHDHTTRHFLSTPLRLHRHHTLIPWF
jgi:hypothetical protein